MLTLRLHEPEFNAHRHVQEMEQQYTISFCSSPAHATSFSYIFSNICPTLPYPTPSLTKRLARIPYELDKIYMDWKEMFTLIFKSFVFATMLQKEKAVNGSKLWRYSAEKPAK